MKKHFLFVLLLLVFIITPFLGDCSTEVTYPTLPGVVSPQDIVKEVEREEDVLPLFITYIFNLLLIISILVAAVVIIYGGFLFITASDDPEKKQNAKKWILSAFQGAIIVLLSYTILFTLDSHLVLFRQIDLEGQDQATGVDLRWEIKNVYFQVPLGLILEDAILNDVGRKKLYDIFYTTLGAEVVADKIEQESTNLLAIVESCPVGKECCEGSVARLPQKYSYKKQEVIPLALFYPATLTAFSDDIVPFYFFISAIIIILILYFISRRKKQNKDGFPIKKNKRSILSSFLCLLLIVSFVISFSLYSFNNYFIISSTVSASEIPEAWRIMWDPNVQTQLQIAMQRADLILAGGASTAATAQAVLGTGIATIATPIVIGAGLVLGTMWLEEEWKEKDPGFKNIDLSKISDLPPIDEMPTKEDYKKAQEKASQKTIEENSEKAEGGLEKKWKGWDAWAEQYKKDNPTHPDQWTNKEKIEADTEKGATNEMWITDEDMDQVMRKLGLDPEEIRAKAAEEDGTNDNSDSNGGNNGGSNGGPDPDADPDADPGPDPDPEEGCTAPPCPKINPPIQEKIVQIEGLMGKFSQILSALLLTKEPIKEDLYNLYKVVMLKSLGYQNIVNYTDFLVERLYYETTEVGLVTDSEEVNIGQYSWGWKKWLFNILYDVRTTSGVRTENDPATFFLKKPMADDAIENALKLAQEAKQNNIQSLAEQEIKETTRTEPQSFLEKIFSFFKNFIAKNTKVKEVVAETNIEKIKACLIESVGTRTVTISECAQMINSCSEKHNIENIEESALGGLFEICGLHLSDIIPDPSLSSLPPAEYLSCGMEIPIGEAVELTWNHLMVLLYVIDAYEEKGRELIEKQVQMNILAAPCECECEGNNCPEECGACELNCDLEAIRNAHNEVVKTRAELRIIGYYIGLLTGGFYNELTEDICFFLNEDIRSNEEKEWCAGGGKKLITAHEIITRKLNYSRTEFDKCLIRPEEVDGIFLGETSSKRLFFGPVAEEYNLPRYTKIRTIEGEALNTSNFNWFCCTD